MFICKVFQLDKSEGADFKYHKSFLKFLFKNTQIRRFWFQIWVVLLFRKVLTLDKVDVTDFKYDYGFLNFWLKNNQVR